MKRKYDAPFWDLHRVDVQRTLAERAEELGVIIRLGARVDNIDFDNANLTLVGGETTQHDLLVGADGIWSKCRQRFLTAKCLEEDAPLPTGDLAYRIVLNIDEVQDQSVKNWISKASCQFWIGPNAHVVAYSIRDGTVSNMVLLVPDNLPPDVARQSGSLEEMRAIFTDWDPTLNLFLDQVKTVEKWKLMHRPELESWISDKSNFVFVGDACKLGGLHHDNISNNITRSRHASLSSSRSQQFHRRRRCSWIHFSCIEVKKPTSRRAQIVRTFAKGTRRSHRTGNFRSESCFPHGRWSRAGSP